MINSWAIIWKLYVERKNIFMFNMRSSSARLLPSGRKNYHELPMNFPRKNIANCTRRARKKCNVFLYVS